MQEGVLASFVRTWFYLCRPWSVTATFVPALFAAGVVCGDPLFVRWRWWLALVAALPLQIACNLLNTWGDDRSGVDAIEGAVVTTPQLRDGLVSSRQVFFAAVGCLAVACACGMPLLFFRRGGDLAVNWGVALAAAIGFMGTTNYATGVKFKYHGLGVPFVFFLMGTIECFGFVAAAAPGLIPSPGIMLATLPVNCLVAVIMHGNDMRDMATDSAAGIKTTASALGPRRALVLYCALHCLPYLSCLAAFAVRIHGGSRTGTALLLPLLALPLAARTMATAWRTYLTNPSNPPWRGLERASGGIHCLFGILYAIALAAIR